MSKELEQIKQASIFDRLESIEGYGFRCEATGLKMCAEWIELKRKLTGLDWKHIIMEDGGNWYEAHTALGYCYLVQKDGDAYMFTESLSKRMEERFLKATLNHKEAKAWCEKHYHDRLRENRYLHTPITE